MELKRIDRILLKAMYCVVAGIIVAQTLGQAQLTSFLFALTFPLTVILWMRSVRRSLVATDFLAVATVVLALLFVMINATANHHAISFEYMKKLIMFSMSILFFQTAHRLRIDRSMINFFQGVVDLLIVFLAFMYFTQNLNMHLLNGQLTTYLTFRMTNPNLTGLYLTCLYMFELQYIVIKEKLAVKIMRIVAAVFLAVCVLQTQSRNALLTLVLYTVVALWLWFRGNENLKIPRLAAACISVFPLAFVTTYLRIAETAWFNSILDFLRGEGKGLDSRISIWKYTFEAFKDSPFFGAYYEISGGTGMSQMHNSLIDIIASYGIVVLILVCVLLYIYLYQYGRVYKSKQNYIYILGFAAVLFMGIGEAALFSGGVGIYIFAGNFLLSANAATEEVRGVVL
ncbi:MAG: O-antigen ligase family protein [Clostridia bacterium]|nr:O-antigen ligase family protein [Clostridia bacterium]